LASVPDFHLGVSYLSEPSTINVQQKPLWRSANASLWIACYLSSWCGASSNYLLLFFFKSRPSA